MGFGCRHNFEYSQGHFRCSKCGMRAKEKQFKRNHNKSYATIVIIGIIIIGGIYVYGNYDITVNNQKIDPTIPLKTVEQKFDELYQTIPTESIDSAIQEFSDSIPIKIEQKPTKLEDKLLDCSKYKREYLEANKDVRTTEDNMAAMIGDALTGVEKTKACEQYNKQIEMQQASQGIVTSDPVDDVYLGGNINDPIVGTFSIGKIIVSEKEYYKVISLNVNVKAENLHLEDIVFLSPIGLTLENEKGKMYVNQPQECSSPLGYQITGKTSHSGSITVCYNVEKEFNEFDAFYRSEDHKNYKIGSFVLN